MKLEFSKYSKKNIDIQYHIDNDVYPPDFRKRFFLLYSDKFAEYHSIDIRGYKKTYRKYIISGIEGLHAFAKFLRIDGFKTARAYYLKPNSIILQDISSTSDVFQTHSKNFSLSFGIEIADDDPTLVEYKLKNM